LRTQFSQDEHSHYLFTPRDLTRWCLSLLRYDFSSIKNDNSAESLLEIWTYEACRLFKDRLVGSNAQEKFDQLLDKILKADWSSNALSALRGNLKDFSLELELGSVESCGSMVFLDPDPRKAKLLDPDPRKAKLLDPDPTAAKFLDPDPQLPKDQG
jgi:hypothetical protein